MPGSRQIPASLRYLKARLKILERPSFWGAVSVLLMAGWFLSEYWNQTLDPITATGDQADLDADLNADRDELADKPAPLDPLSTVDETTSGEASDFLTDLPTASTSAKSAADALFPTLTVSDPIATPADRGRSTSWRSPFSASPTTSTTDFSQVPELPTINLLPTTNSLNGSNLSSEAGASQTSDTQTTAQTGASINPLQAALDRYAPGDRADNSPNSPNSSNVITQQPGSSSFSSTVTPATPTATAQEQLYTPLSLPGQAPLPQPLPGQPAPYQTLTQPVYLPQTSPPVGTTGYTPPPMFQTNPSSSTGMGTTGIGTSYSDLTSAPSGRGTVPSIPNTASPPQVVSPSPIAAPFSVPRSVPGRSIGGGQINTFSNP